MAIRLSRANSITADDNNRVVGKLISIEVVESQFTNQSTGEVSETEQIEWIWEVATRTGKPTQLHEWTGLNVNSEKTWTKGEQSYYNKLTTILIQTKLINAKKIDDTNLEDIDIESLLDREFEFELEKRTTKNIKSVNLTTLKLVD